MNAARPPGLSTAKDFIATSPPTVSIPLEAEMETVVAPAAVGVPEIRSVPGVEPAPMDRPGGRVPVSTRVGVGPPLVVTATDPATPRLK